MVISYTTSNLNCQLCKAGYKPVCNQTCSDSVYGISNVNYPRIISQREADLKRLLHELEEVINKSESKRATSDRKRKLLEIMLKSKRRS